MWYADHIGGGRCPVVDTWWQTETGAIMIAPLPGLTTTKPGSATFPLPGHRGRGGRRGGRAGRARRRLPHPDHAVAVDAAGHLRRPRALPGDLLEPVRGPVLRRRRGQDRRRRLPLAARPGRRRHERVGPPHLHHRGGVGAGRPPLGGRGGGGRGQRRHHRPGHRRLRDPGGRRRRRRPTSAARSCGPTWPTKIGPDRPAQDGDLHRRAAEDPQRQDHAPAAARRGRGPGPGRHHHAGRPGRGGGDPAAVGGRRPSEE